MRIIRKSEQRILHRPAENRDVRLLFDGSVHLCDWLVVTHSRRQLENAKGANVEFHSHPNAFELIFFLRKGLLETNGKQHHFEPGDLVVLESQDVHGAQDLSEHDCICIILGKGQPQKRSLKGEQMKIIGPARPAKHHRP